jgi:hypothetical protein
VYRRPLLPLKFQHQFAQRRPKGLRSPLNCDIIATYSSSKYFSSVSSNSRFSTSFATSANQLGLGLRAFSESALIMRTALNSFAGHATSLSDAISKIPHTLKGSFEHRVVVVHNGVEAFATMVPAIEKMIVDNTRSELNRVFSSQMPDAGLTA